MKIALIDIDGHAKKKKWGATVYPNLALAKIAAYHNSKGDDVEWYEPMFSGHCDKVYMSKIFNFSADYEYAIDADEIVRGGTGYDIKSVLPQEIDECQPDYSIYPNVPQDVSYGFLTRGCPNKCPWCVVPIKEGKIRPYWDIERVANGRKKIVLMDNNILAAGDYAHEQLDKIISLGYKVDFNQALDARLVTEDFAKQLAQVKWIDRRIRFGCDTKAQVKECLNAVALIRKHGFNGEFFFYTMLHGTFEECFSRIQTFKELNDEQRRNHSGGGMFAYAQPYRDPNNPDAPIPQWQKDLAQWCNKRQLYGSCDFKDFEPRKNFKCRQYLNKQEIQNQAGGTACVVD